jgi:hypothetical protein
MAPAPRAGVAGRPERAGWYALVLVVVAPFLAETVASANTPAVLFPVVLPLYAVVYGCPALLLREMWARGRLTAARLLLLGVAYTAFNEGVVAATWFKLAPDTGRVLAFTSDQAGHAAGVNWAVAVGLVVFHTVYSLMIPVTVVHALAVVRGRGSDRRPWIGRKGTVACWVLVGVVLLGSLTPKATAQVCSGPAMASCSLGRLGAAAMTVLIAVTFVFLRAPRRSPAAARGSAAHGRTSPLAARVPATRPLLAGVCFGVLFFCAFFALPLAGLPWTAVAVDVLLLAGIGVAAARWCRAWGRDLRGDLLLSLGMLLPGMVLSVAFWHVGQPMAALAAAALYRYLLVRLPTRQVEAVPPARPRWPGGPAAPQRAPGPPPPGATGPA